MGLIPDWVKEFPGQLIATFKENAKENWPEFKAEIVGGAKAVLQVPAKIVSTVIQPLNKSLIIIGIIALILIVFWKKITKLVGI